MSIKAQAMNEVDTFVVMSLHSTHTEDTFVVESLQSTHTVDTYMVMSLHSTHTVVVNEDNDSVLFTEARGSVAVMVTTETVWPRLCLLQKEKYQSVRENLELAWR